MLGKIRITGSSGFVGLNLSLYLKKLFLNVVLVAREDLQNIVFELDDVLIHLAGKAHDVKNTSNSKEYYDTNFELTKNLYDVFTKSDAKTFIFISSVKAVADSVEGILTENHIPNPQTHYGKSKLMAEEYILSKALPEGKSFYIIRPCMIHGPGNKGNLNLLYKFVQKGLPYPLAGFNNKRSFLSIENLCFVINEIITGHGIPSGIYQVADDYALSTNEVISVLASSINTKPKFWTIPPVVIKIIAKIGDVLHLPLTTERLTKLTESYVVSNQKIKKALNKELPLTAIEGLKITANSFNQVKVMR